MPILRTKKFPLSKFDFTYDVQENAQFLTEKNHHKKRVDLHHEPVCFIIETKIEPHFDIKKRLRSLSLLEGETILYRHVFAIQEEGDLIPCGGFWNETASLSDYEQCYKRSGSNFGYPKSRWLKESHQPLDIVDYPSLNEAIETGAIKKNGWYSVSGFKKSDDSRFVYIKMTYSQEF